MKRSAIVFIREFFDLNPLSQLSIIVTQNEKAFAISEFQDSPNTHIKAVEELQTFTGNASTQSALNLSLEAFRIFAPQYAKKEVLILFNSITNCDKGNIFETI